MAIAVRQRNETTARRLIRRFTAVLAAAAIGSMGLVTPPASAAVIDQQNTGAYVGIVDAFNFADHEAQTFVAGTTGYLGAVALPITLHNPAAGDLVVTITGLTGGLPDESNVLVTQTYPPSAVAGSEFTDDLLTFTNPPPITQGTGYAIVLSSTAGGLACGGGQCPGESYYVLLSNGAGYSSGVFCGNVGSGYSCSSAFDFLFKTYVDLYQLQGFFEPVSTTERNVAQAGKAVPVRWRAVDGTGTPVSDPAHFVSVSSEGETGATCGTASPDAIEEYVGNSGLRYLGDGNWQFNWQTPKSYAGQCRTMVLTLAGNTRLEALFQFK